MSKARDIADSTKTLDVDGGTIKLDGNYPVGSGNVALGDAALDDGSLSGGYNTAIGRNTLTANTSGQENTALGNSAQSGNTTGSYNSVVGSNALKGNTSGSSNSAVGYAALFSNTTASNNTAVGYQAGYSNTGNGGLTHLGYRAGYSGTGAYNTLIGYQAGKDITTGQRNTVLGAYNGNQGGLDIRTSSNRIVLSDGDGNPRGVFSSDGFFSTAGKVTPDDTTLGVHLKKSGTTTGRVTFTGDGSSSDAGFYGTNTSGSGVFIVRPNGNVQNQNNSYGAISDQNLKENIQDASSQWDDIKSLRVRKYSLISEQSDTPTQLGVIAQEVEAAGMNGLVHETWDIANPDVNIKHVKYSILYMKTVKALQEAMDRIETLEAKVTALENA